MLKNLKWVFTLLTVCGASVFTACSTANDDNPTTAPEYTGVPLVILDTDIGSSTDDLFSLEMLHYYQQQGRCKLLGVVVDREGEDCAACADVMNTYFGCRDRMGATSKISDVPVGLVRDGIKHPRVWIDYRALPTYTKVDDDAWRSAMLEKIRDVKRYIKKATTLKKNYLYDGENKSIYYSSPWMVCSGTCPVCVAGVES